MFLPKDLKNILEEILSPFNFSSEVEEAYQRSSYPISIFMMRLAVVLGGLTYLGFYGLDALIFPDIYLKIWGMRTIVMAIFIVTLMLTYRPFFAKIHQRMLFILLVCIVLGQFYAIALTNSDLGNLYFFNGFFIILACAYALSQLNLKNCLWLFVFIIFGYLWVSGFYMGRAADGWFSENGLLLMNDCFFLFSMNTIGIVAYITIQYFRRKGFLAQILAEEERRSAAIERLRVKISSDLHDDVGSILTGLAMQTEILQQGATEDRSQKLQRLGQLSRDAMSRMRDAVWAMDTRKDKWESLQDRMREFAEETLGEKGIDYQIKFENINFQNQLPSEIRQNLYLIFKEAITNVVKHAQASKVNIFLKNVGAAFEMKIKDNGIGRKQNDFQSAGLGLSNMQLRAEQIQANLEFLQKDGFGILLRREKM